LRIAGASNDPIFSSEAIEAVHVYSAGIPRVVNLLCEHSLINGYVEQQRPIGQKTVEDVAHEFQLDEVPPTAVPASPRPLDEQVYTSESFIQNLGEALSKFRVSTSVPRERK
jgi:hypothetical protein